MEVKNLILGAGVGVATMYGFGKASQGAELGAIGMIPVAIGVGLIGANMVGGGEGMIGAVIAVAIAYSIGNAQAKASSAALAQQTAVYSQAANSCPSGSTWLTCVNQKMQTAGYPPVQSVNGVVMPPG